MKLNRLDGLGDGWLPGYEPNSKEINNALVLGI